MIGQAEGMVFHLVGLSKMLNIISPPKPETLPCLWTDYESRSDDPALIFLSSITLPSKMIFLVKTIVNG